jgi:hypothetical protein
MVWLTRVEKLVWLLRFWVLGWTYPVFDSPRFTRECIPNIEATPAPPAELQVRVAWYCKKVVQLRGIVTPTAPQAPIPSNQIEIVLDTDVE